MYGVKQSKRLFIRAEHLTIIEINGKTIFTYETITCMFGNVNYCQKKHCEYKSHHKLGIDLARIAS